jgi:hypothetical protein
LGGRASVHTPFRPSVGSVSPSVPAGCASATNRRPGAQSSVAGARTSVSARCAPIRVTPSLWIAHDVGRRCLSSSHSTSSCAGACSLHRPQTHSAGENGGWRRTPGSPVATPRRSFDYRLSTIDTPHSTLSAAGRLGVRRAVCASESSRPPGWSVHGSGEDD